MPRHEPTGRSAAFVAWGGPSSRANELARACGAQALRTRPEYLRGPATAPLRWAISAVQTTAWLAARRPDTLVVQNPPVFLVLLALVWRRLVGGRLLLDSHPTSFGRKNSRFWALFVPLHRFAARRSVAVLVTVEELADEVRSWGSQALIVHEPPPENPPDVVEPDASGASGARQRTVLFIGIFAPDEPVQAVVDAAALMPEVRFAVTGDVTRAPEGLVKRASPNVDFVGFLGPEDFEAELRSADVVLALTTEPTSIIRAAYEATYAQRPLVTSATDVLAEAFPWATHVANEGDSIAAAARSLLGPDRPTREALEHARHVQEQRWSEQVTALRAALGVA